MVADLPEDARKKRVVKACDSCRMKKTKCDGRKPCTRCAQDDKLCTYSEKKKQQEKTYSSSYVELLETRIEILQDSLQKLVTKIAAKEDVECYVPSNGDISINRIIELMAQDGSVQADVAQLTRPMNRTDSWASNLTVESLNQSYTDALSSDDEESSPASSLEAHHNSTVLPAPMIDHGLSTAVIASPAPPVDIPRQSMPQHRPSVLTAALASPVEDNVKYGPALPDNTFGFGLDTLGLGPYKTGAAMAAAAMTGEYVPSNMGSASPLSTTSSPQLDSYDSHESVPWGTVSPAMLSEPSRNIGNPSFFSLNNASKSTDDLVGSSRVRPQHPHRVHKAGSVHSHHQHSPTSPGPYYIKEAGSRIRERSLSKTSSRPGSISLDEKPALGVVPRHNSQLHMSTAAMSSSAIDDDDPLLMAGMNQYVEIDEINNNLDELFLGTSMPQASVSLYDDPLGNSLAGDVRV